MREVHTSDHQSTQYHRILLVVVSIFGLVRAGSAPPYHPYRPPLSHPPPHFKGPHILPYPPCPEYGGCRKNFAYVPAPPGETPNCANSGSTFCENIDSYPQHIIQHLVDNADIDFGTLLKDESRDEFKPKMTTTTTTTTTTPRPYVPQSMYGLPYPGHQSPVYLPHLNGGGRPRNSPHLPLAPPSIPPHPFLNFSQPQPTGYPGRQYTLFHYNPGYVAPADDPDFIYSALIRPELAAQQFNEQINHTPWWKRFTRSEGSTANDKIRTRRQSNNNGNGTSVTLCPTRSEYVMPKAAMNSKGNWMYVVNLEQDRFTQLVRSTTCISDQCSGLCSLPSGYTSRCEQQYVQKRLVALESGGSRLYTDVFWFPHCCLCQITQTGGTNNG